jgi:quercetin dioxygenase-like cupin family protein
MLTMTRTTEIVRLFTGSDGASHFRNETLDVAAVPFAPPAPDAYISAPVPAHRFLLLVLPPGWSSDPHPAPSRQFMVMMRGALEVTTSDGEQRIFSAGDIVLVEDVTGAGHATASIDGEAVLAVTQT